MDGNPERWQPDQPAQQPQQPQQAPAGPPFDYGQGPPSGGYPAGGVPSGGQPPPGVSGPGGGLPPAALVGIGVIVVLVLAIGAVLVMDSGDSDDDPETEAASDVQEDEAPADDGSATTAPPEDETADDGTSDDGGTDDGGTDDGAADDGSADDGEGGGHWDGVDPASLPAPDIPGEADAQRPELRPEHDGMEHPYNPFEDEYWPIIGEVYADVTPGDHIDLPVYLEAGEVAVMFNANDQVYSEVEIYDPNGEVIATAEELGEPEVVEGYEFSEYSDEALTEAGVYVFRVIQHSGVEGGFPIRFFTPDGPAEGE